MEVINPRCCGLDVHKKTVVACVISAGRRETRTFSTMTRALLELKDWLSECSVTHVAMESTGVFWKPIFNLLEDNFKVMVVNAQHIKAVPGRKTDVKDAEWIADLLRHGLVRGSFVPDRKQRELRELVRYRRGLIRQRADVVNRIQKVLEGANIKLSSVATDVVGVSGRAMLEAMVKGTDNPQTLAAMAKGSLRDKQADLVEALQGLVGLHQRMLLDSLLRHLDFLDKEISRLDGEVAQRMSPFDEAIDRLDGIHGMGRRSMRYSGLTRKRKGKIYQISDKGDCLGCCNFGKCTTSRNGRKVMRLNAEELRNRLEREYILPQNQAIYKRRQENAELPYGHIKRNLGVSSFLLRGREGARAEMSILSVCFNVRRMLSILGHKGIIAKLKGISPNKQTAAALPIAMVVNNLQQLPPVLTLAS